LDKKWRRYTNKANIGKKTRSNNSIKHTADEEGGTTPAPGKRKPKNKTTTASTESIITTIKGNIEQIEVRIEVGTKHKITVTSPERQHICNIPEMIRNTKCNEFKPSAMITKNNKEIGKETSNSQQDSVGKKQKMKATTATTIKIKIKIMKKNKEKTGNDVMMITTTKHTKNI
jgi:hypothetical protein